MQEAIKFNIFTLKEIEPLISEYFGYKRNMISDELSASFRFNYNPLTDIPNKEQYMINEPCMGEYLYDEGVFDWKRYAPKEENSVKVFDTVSFMIDTDHFIVFEIPDSKITDKISYFLLTIENKFKIDSEEEVIKLYNILLIVYVIYSKYKVGELYTDIIWNDNIMPYLTKVRPEMLKLYEMLKLSHPKPKGSIISPKPITMSRGTQSITLDDSAFWLSDLLSEYLNIYLGVEDVKDAQEEYERLYKPTKGRKPDLAFNILVMGIYKLMNDKYPFGKKSDLLRFILGFLDSVGYFDENDIRNDENYLGSAIAYLEKQNFKPQWKPKQMEDYKTSSNNPSSEYLW